MPGSARHRCVRLLVRLMVLGAGALAAAGPAGAAELLGGFDLVPGVTVRSVYSDNVGLDAAGQERSDLVFDVTPRFSIRRRGLRTQAEAEGAGEGGAELGIEEGTEGRIQLNFDYGIQSLGGGGGATSDFNQLLQTDLEAELLRQRLFLDARATITQQSVSNRDVVVDSNIVDSTNRTEVVTFQVSPHTRHRLGPYADGEVRFTLDGVYNLDVEGTDSTATTLGAVLRSGRAFARFPWTLSGSVRRIDNEAGSDPTLRRVSAAGTYAISRKWSVTQTVGYDFNDFQSLQSTSGFRWRSALNWRPNRRLRASVGYGGQFSGRSVSFDVEYRHRRLVFEGRLQEDVTTVRRVQLDRVIIPLIDPFGAPIVDPFAGAPVGLAVDLPTLTDDVLVAQRFDGSAAWRGRNARARLGLFHTNREFQRSGEEETVFGTTAGWSHRFARNTFVSLDGRWQETEFDALARTDQRWLLAATMSREFGRSVRGNASYQYQQQTSDAAGSEFEENRVIVSVDMNF